MKYTQTHILVLMISFISPFCLSMEAPALTHFHFFMQLPKDIQQNIFSPIFEKISIKNPNLLYEDPLAVKETLQSLVPYCALPLVNKDFNQRFKEYFSITKLAQKMHVTPRAIALHLIQLGALKHTKELKYPANKDLDGQLIKAMDHANGARFLWLLEQNADVNAKNRDRPALIAGSANESYTAVKALIAYGANINIQDNFRNTALHCAAAKGYLNILNLLIASGADVNIQNQWLDTALIKAVCYNKKDIVQLLLDAKAGVHLKNLNKQTALDFACARSRLDDIAELLIKYGATE